MKKTQILFYALILTMSVGLFYSCDPDPVDIIDPAIEFVAGDGYYYQDTSLQKGQVFKVKVIATAGTNDLDLLQINENDVALSLDRIVSGLNSNPALALGADAQGFTKEIEITAQSEGISKYSFIVQDKEGYTNAVSFLIDDVYEGLDNEVGELIVYNFNGPNMGSLDLHAPATVSSSDPDGDIQDVGINTDLPSATNWLQQIKPKNGAELFLPADGLTYDEITSKEALKAAVEAGTQLAVSQTLNIGDVYLAKTASLEGETSDYFILRVDDIQIMEDNNEDFYEFTLKQALNM